MRIISGLDWIGHRAISYMEEIGLGAVLLMKILRGLVRRPFPLKLTLQQMEEVGVRSLPVVLITAVFTGAVLALQTYSGFKRFGAEGLVGTVVALSMTRELGPVLASIMVAAVAITALRREGEDLCVPMLMLLSCPRMLMTRPR